MSIRNARAFNFRPKTASDTFDATNAAAGAMAQLSNLIPAPQTQDAFVPRPASVISANFTTAGFTTPGQGEAAFQNGSRIYGIIQSGRNAGKSEPFIYDLNASAFVTISGIASGNTPTKTSNSGDWTPPTVAQVGAYVIFTHPGFALPNAFGWLDMSGFSTTVTGDTNTNTTISGNPVTAGINPGMTITGTNIPANTRVVSTALFTLVEQGTTHSNTTLDGLASTTGLAVGQTVSGAGIPAGTTISAVGVGSVTLSQAATASATVQVTFAGATITISAAATGSTNGSTFTVAGGTFAAPLWAAGNLNTTPLLAVPVAVVQYAGSALYAVNTTSPPSAAVVFSDSGAPLQCTNSPTSQIVTFQNASPIAAMAGLPLNTIQGGIVQSVYVFQSVNAIWQITGAPVTSNLTINTVNDNTGTQAALSVVSTPQGLMFCDHDGLRIVNPLGVISKVVGRRGQGIDLPFLFAQNPTRICAAYNEGIYRISVQNAALPNTPTQEWWYHMDDQIWTGPHTFPACVICANSVPHSFSLFAPGVNGILWLSDSYASLAANYVENGTQMTFLWQTSLLPDTQDLSMNAVIETTLAIAIPPQQNVQATAIDEQTQLLGAAQISGDDTAPSLWGTAIWGTGIWGAGASYFRQRNVEWGAPLVFKQMQVQLVGNCIGGLEIGNLYMQYQRLGYKLLTATG